MLAAAVCLPATAAAEIRFFQTPSKNIGCGYLKEKNKRASIRCDIRSQDNPPEPKPPSCEFDFGRSYAMSARGKARRACVSDAVSSPSSRILGYGEMFKRGGITCTSRMSGLRCHNRSRHGFKLNRSKQTLF